MTPTGSTKSSEKPVIAVTIGDPAGVGPELVAQLFARAHEFFARFVAIGDAKVLAAAFKLVGTKHQLVSVETPAAADELSGNQAAIINLDKLSTKDFEPGKINSLCGASAVAGIRLAADLVANGKVKAVVSAPANKVSMQQAGDNYPGQTEIFLERWGLAREEAHIMLIGGDLKCSLVTGHCSMQEAIRRIKRDRVEKIASQANRTLQQLFKIAKPRIGVAGLNCHAGDGGLFGRQEIEEINPAIAKLRIEGLNITDARPADALFLEAERGDYDGVLAMYHDQGVIPLKRYGYVTVIAGAPYIRTTCGHGTAFDIAWKSKVDSKLFLRAVALAVQLTEFRE
jgi:4-hydroxythreonine-4-phosphate dehydrogenase